MTGLQINFIPPVNRGVKNTIRYSLKILLPLALLLCSIELSAQNCNVDFPGISTRTFSSACGGASTGNLELGINHNLSDGDVFIFDVPEITITGNLHVDVEGSGKIVIPAGVTVNVGGHFDIHIKNGACTPASPCILVIEVNGNFNISKDFKNDAYTIQWSGTGTVTFDDKIKNSNDACMACGPGGCPQFQGDPSECDDDCADGNFCSNIAPCSSDVTPPIISGCPSLRVVNMTGSGCVQPVSWTPPTVSDNCMVASFTSSHKPGTTFPLGITTVTYTAVDAAGNRATCSFNVNVVDNTAPVITDCPADITVNANASCNAAVSWTPPAFTDNCTGAKLTTTKAPGSIFNKGITTVTYTATDAAGNFSTCQFSVVVKNESLPSISNCPNEIVIEGNDEGVARADWIIPTASATCGEVILSASHNPGDVFHEGTTLVEYYATDEAGNSSSCSFNVVVSPMKIDIDISQVITPDGNGINDTWIIKNIEKFTGNSVAVVDRWGNVIFSATGYDNKNVVWHGKNHSGGLAPTGTYYYMVSVQSARETFKKTGFIELVR